MGFGKSEKILTTEIFAVLRRLNSTDATSDRSAENSSKCHSSFLKSVFYDSSKIDILLDKGQRSLKDNETKGTYLSVYIFMSQGTSPGPSSIKTPSNSDLKSA